MSPLALAERLRRVYSVEKLYLLARAKNLRALQAAKTTRHEGILAYRAHVCRSSCVGRGACRVRIESRERTRQKNQVAVDFVFFNRIDPPRSFASDGYLASPPGFALTCARVKANWGSSLACGASSCFARRGSPIARICINQCAAPLWPAGRHRPAAKRENLIYVHTVRVVGCDCAGVYTVTRGVGHL